MKSIVTGASGFVGRVLSRMLGDCTALPLGSPRWREAIAAADFRGATVFHLAARVHRASDDSRAFHEDNVDKTVDLAEAAARGGAGRIVFLSSIKVNGEFTKGRPFRPDDPAAPADAYARSKWEAECALAEISRSHGIPVAVVRSPLVVGDGARGNLRALLRLADTPLPLPFAALDNRRTLVHVEDLARLLEACAVRGHDTGRVYLAGDPDSVSTARLVRTIRQALGRPNRLVSIPAAVLEGCAALGGRRDAMRRLTRSLEADSSRARDELGWKIQVPMDEGIARMARAFRGAGEHA